MYYLLYILFVLGLFHYQAFAQYTYGFKPIVSIGPTVGITHYQGDLDDNLGIKFAKPAFGFVAGVHLHPHLFVRGNFLHGWISGSDANSGDAFRKNRNLSFISPVTEFSLQIGYDYFVSQKGWKFRPKFCPYVFFGVGAFRFNPMANPDSTRLSIFNTAEYIPLQPLGTEGQKTKQTGSQAPYNLIQICIPMGIGFRQTISKHFDIRVEFGMRKTFTDYLDDVSHKYVDPDLLTGKARVFADRSLDGNAFETEQIRGFKEQGDWYVYTSFSLIYIITASEVCPKFK